MNYTQKIQKLKQNSKALSPVVASIILIAVTVAVSIAVAAWMGGLAGGFMETEQLQIDTQTFVLTNTTSTPTVTGSVSVIVRNTATSPVVISSAYINGVTATMTSETIAANGQTTVVLTAPTGITIDAGNNYEVKIVTSKNNAFATTAIAIA